jgi:hypothetical protein
MNPTTFLSLAIDPALQLLPGKMQRREARVMLLAIALQESRLQHRRQIRGPARGYFQFEHGGGVAGVLRHPATRPHIEQVCRDLDYPADVDACYIAIEHNDVLAAAFARLNLWWLPTPLADNEQDGWHQYLAAWRPGKPHPGTWPDLYRQAVMTVTNGSPT